MKTRIETYSLESGRVGAPVGTPEVTEYPTGREALLALNKAIRKNQSPHNTGKRYLIEFPDGRQLPFDAAYTAIFGVRPIHRDNRENLYPRLKS